MRLKSALEQIRKSPVLNKIIMEIINISALEQI
jgi:hypothetical protein